MADDDLTIDEKTINWLREDINTLRAQLEQAQENTKTLLANHQNVRAQLEQAQAERDAAFSMSKCECQAEECCQNLARLHATIARQREWIEKAGHRPGCAALRADVPEGWHESDDTGPDVIILPGPCDCGYSEHVGG